MPSPPRIESLEVEPSELFWDESEKRFKDAFGKDVLHFSCTPPGAEHEVKSLVELRAKPEGGLRFSINEMERTIDVRCDWEGAQLHDCRVDAMYDGQPLSHFFLRKRQFVPSVSFNPDRVELAQNPQEVALEPPVEFLKIPWQPAGSLAKCNEMFTWAEGKRALRYPEFPFQLAAATYVIQWLDKAHPTLMGSVEVKVKRQLRFHPNPVELSLAKPSCSVNVVTVPDNVPWNGVHFEASDGISHDQKKGKLVVSLQRDTGNSFEIIKAVATDGTVLDTLHILISRPDSAASGKGYQFVAQDDLVLAVPGLLVANRPKNLRIQLGASAAWEPDVVFWIGGVDTAIPEGAPLTPAQNGTAQCAECRQFVWKAPCTNPAVLELPITFLDRGQGWITARVSAPRGKDALKLPIDSEFTDPEGKRCIKAVFAVE